MENNHCNPSKDNLLCLVVPFRDRFDELLIFAPHITKFLCKQKVNHQILIVNQVDLFRFNRGSLINIGFLYGLSLKCTFIAMHDVDLLPNNNELLYAYPKNGPLHISSPQLHPNYHYKKFVGGILLMSNEHFKMVNGLSNKFWGWGLEDDELYLRIKAAKLKIYSPEQITTGNKTFIHIHNRLRRKRDMRRYGDQKARSKRDLLTGMNNVNYTMLSQYSITVNGSSVWILNVRLECNVFETPWCLDPDMLIVYLKNAKKELPLETYNLLLQSLKKNQINLTKSLEKI